MRRPAGGKPDGEAAPPTVRSVGRQEAPPGGAPQSSPGLVVLQPGTVIDERYVVDRLLNTPSGEADLCVCRTQATPPRTVVVKLYRPSFRPDEKVLSGLKGLQHEDLVSLLDVGRWLGRFYEVMEYAAGGSLAERCAERPFTERELTERVLPEVLNALKACHQRGIVHRDLKESNLYYRDAGRTDIVLGDFGISSVAGEFGELRLTTREGFTIEYAAPECHVRFGDDAGMIVSPAQDYYSLGITLLKLLGFNPFKRLPHLQIIKIKTEGAMDLPESVSPRFRNLLRGLLHRIPEHRAGYEQVSAWLRGEEIEIAPEPSLAPARALRPLYGQPVRTLEDVGSLLLRNPKDGEADIERHALIKYLDDVDLDTGRRVHAIAEKATSSRCKLIETAFFLNPQEKYPLREGVLLGSPAELPAAADASTESWRAASEQLANDELIAWLLGLGHNDLVKVWREQERAIAVAGDRDAALEAFLHLVGKDVSRPGVHFAPSTVSLAGITAEGPIETQVTVTNPGRGCLFGTVSLQPEIPGVRLRQKSVKAHRALKIEHKVVLDIAADRLERGRSYRGMLVLESNHGTAVKAPVFIRRVFPTHGVLRYAAIGALLGGAIMGGARLIIYGASPSWMSKAQFDFRSFSSVGRGFSFGEELVFVLGLCVLVGGPILAARIRTRGGK